MAVEPGEFDSWMGANGSEVGLVILFAENMI